MADKKPHTFNDKNGSELAVNDKVSVLRTADGWKGHLRQKERTAPFSATVVGFAGVDQVVVEVDGLRYNLQSTDVEKTA